MTTSTSRLAYQDCIAVFDKADADEFGCRIRMKNYNAAIHYRMRLHTARSIDRRDNKAIHHDKPDHPLYGRSIYDKLVCRVLAHDGHWWVYVHKTAMPGEIEELSALPPEQRLPENEVEQIEESKVEILPPPPLQIERIRRRF